MPNYAQWTNRNEVRSPQMTFLPSRHNADHIEPYQQWTWSYDSATRQRYSNYGLFESESVTPAMRQFFQWEYKGLHRRIIPIILSAFNIGDIFQKYGFSFDSRFFQLNGIADAFNANNGGLRSVQLAWRWATQLLYFVLLPVRCESVNPTPHHSFAFRYHHYRFHQTTFVHRWDALLTVLVSHSIRWDAIQNRYFILPLHHRAFVRAGWRILAKNILTDERCELGFIDADDSELVLQDIALPDGDYEITVLTSSLFWKNAYSPTIQSINVSADSEFSSLPNIYHIRSSVLQGKTTIQWSATPNGDENCLFALWYSSDVPADKQQPPDETLWYFPNQSEYQTAFLQTVPAYLTIAVMRPGNEPELGTKHELFLDWKTTPPRAPDDVIVLDAPLSAVDSGVLSHHQDESDVIVRQ